MKATRCKEFCTAFTIIAMTLAMVLVLAAAPDVCVGAGAGWFQQASGTTDGLVDISAVDADTAWAVGTAWEGAESHGTILRTVDGGTTWSSQISDRHTKLNAVSAISADTAWIAGGTPGMISKTVDGGATWIGQDIGGSISITSLAAVDTGTVWAAAGYQGQVYKSEDGGATWTQQDLGSVTIIKALHAVDADTVWVIAGTGVTLSTFITADGGATWSSQAGAPYANALSALDATTAWAATTSVVRKTMDGGASWSTQASESYFKDICALNATTVWAAGISGRIGKSTDGTNWFSQDSGTANTLNSISAVDAGTAWAVGADGTILKTEDGGGGPQPPGITSITPGAAMVGQLVKIEGSHFGYDQDSSFVSFGAVQPTHYSSWKDTEIYCTVPALPVGNTEVTVTTGVATSVSYPFEVLGASENGWNIQDSGTHVTLTGVSAIDGDTAWAVGQGGIILKTSDGGETWVEQDSGISGGLAGVSAVDADTAFAVGTGEDPSGPIFLKTTDGGNNWVSLPPDASLAYSLSRVSAVDADNIWVVGAVSGYTPVILKTSDGGASWEKKETGLEMYMMPHKSVCAADADTAWVTGGIANMDLTTGYVVKTGDGGATWSQQQLGYIDWSDVSAVDDLTVWITGRYYYYLANPPTDNPCYLSTDGGATWKDLPMPTTNTMSLVAAVDADTAWITEASHGSIWKTISGGDSWSHQTDMLEYIYDISAVDCDNAWAVGANGLILHTSGGGLRPAPTITSVEPDQGSQLSIWFGITNLAGTGFEAGAKVRLEKGPIVLDAYNVNVVSDTQITCTVGLFGVEPGAYDVVLVNPDGQEARLEGGFTVVSQCGQGAGASLLVFGLMMGLLSLAGSTIFRKRHSKDS